ncbi:hypothetical protein LTR16_007009, partial [Cryomyces antarcticus]
MDDRRKDSNAEPLGGRRNLGLGNDYRGTDQQRQQLRESMLALQPPTREEIARTIFVGGITEGVSDEGLERILRTAGNLRRWTRATDADGKACKFGFAEYEDVESLETAKEILGDVQVPLKKPEIDGAKKEEGEEKPIQKTKLLVVVDENSLNYIEEWKGRRGDDDPATAQFRLDSAKEALSQVLSALERPAAPATNGHIDRDGDISMQDNDALKSDGAEVITIPLTVEDELSDIPAEMRETVAGEIAAFRDRSIRRDRERLAEEERMEAAERARSMRSRLSPPISAPSGPAGGANGIP